MKCLDHLRQAEDAGWAGASLKLAIEPFPYINWPPRYRWLRKVLKKVVGVFVLTLAIRN
ncbi:MAG: hypothetical protein MZV63_07380 [Marinilabiliales bacterium]|nr:hypothetical protein [Marinilabiliales bacterium]